MKKLTRILKNLYLPSCLGLIALSTVASAQPSNDTYISLDYGAAKMAAQNQEQNITLIKNTLHLTIHCIFPNQLIQIVS